MCDYPTTQACANEEPLWSVTMPGAPISDGRTYLVCRDHARDAAKQAMEAWWRDGASTVDSNPEASAHARRMVEDHRPLLDIIPDTKGSLGLTK